MSAMNERVKRFALLTIAIGAMTFAVCRGSISVAAAPPPLAYPVNVLPSDTDGALNDGADGCNGQTGPGIGCDDDGEWGLAANNRVHYLYVPDDITPDGKLLVFLCGGNGTAEPCLSVFEVAAEQGYHVIGLTYPVVLDACNGDGAEVKLVCFGEVVKETVRGDDNYSDRTDFDVHGQDSIANRLVNVLRWIKIHQNPGDGWERFLTAGDQIDWTKIHIAGFSNGSTHASFMGMEYPDIGRTTLFSGPNDGDGDTAAEWRSSYYIQNVPGITDTRYYGLVHYLNKAKSYEPGDNILFKVTKNWEKFGMEGVFEFDPADGFAHDFGNSHVLISNDEPPPGPSPTPVPSQGTTFVEAHTSVIKDKYCTAFELDEETENDLTDYRCSDFGGATIGYKPAWRCILGSGNREATTRPISNAGANQTVECQGNGGANVDLDGSASTDYDCDILTYAWSGPFGTETGRNPNVFCPLGINFVQLTASDLWFPSLLPSTTVVNVVDTTAPSLSVTLTPTVLWPADHRLVRIDASVIASDSCGAGSPTIVLASVTNSQADNGLGDGDTDHDIQGATIDTFDRSFYLRAERAGNNTAGRTYTVTYTATDASGNQTQATATVFVPHS